MRRYSGLVMAVKRTRAKAQPRRIPVRGDSSAQTAGSFPGTRPGLRRDDRGADREGRRGEADRSGAGPWRDARHGQPHDQAAAAPGARDQPAVSIDLPDRRRQRASPTNHATATRPSSGFSSRSASPRPSRNRTPKGSSITSAARRWPRSSGICEGDVSDGAPMRASVFRQVTQMYPTLVRVGDFELTTFGALVAIAALVGLWIFHRELARGGLPESGSDAALIGVLGGLAGAKLIWAIEFRHDAPFLSLLFSRGGLSWFGGFLGGVGAGLWALRRRRIPIVPALSAAAPALAVGHAIGRIGCFLVGDDYGRPTDLPWAVAFPRGLPPTTVPVHPTQLYEAAGLGGHRLVTHSMAAKQRFRCRSVRALPCSRRLFAVCHRVHSRQCTDCRSAHARPALFRCDDRRRSLGDYS